jgi:hypothetical protein
MRLAAGCIAHIFFGPPLTLLSRHVRMADTVDYVRSAYLHDQVINWAFWDFRHLLWRPLGWLLFHVLKPWVASGTEADARADITIIFLISYFERGDSRLQPS